MIGPNFILYSHVMDVPGYSDYIRGGCGTWQLDATLPVQTTLAKGRFRVRNCEDSPAR
jgi:translation elongation factor EF-Tu-like GTPase